MKRRIFLVCLFYCFFRLPINESIAAIFWQSASYVFYVLLIEAIAFFPLDDLNCVYRTSSRDSLPGNRPSVRGRQMNDSFGRVSATGDDVDAMNDSVFNQENSIHIEGGGGSGIVYSSNPGLSARKLSAASSGMGSQERLKSASGHNLNNMNSSFTKPKSAFSNDSLSKLANFLSYCKPIHIWIYSVPPQCFL